jgi:hypothetical protein
MMEKISLKELMNFFEKQEYALHMANKYKYLLYGGSAGPGKSYWLRWYPIYKLMRWHAETGQKGIVAGLFCEDYPSLKDRHIGKIESTIPRWLGEVKDTKTYGLGFHLRAEYGGGVLALRNLDDPSKYLSSEFALVAVDELTRNQKEVFDMLRLRLRWTGINDPKFISATNPGGIGHGWVKKLWMDKQFDENEIEANQFFYVKALPDDNPHLPKTYFAQLESLPEKLRKAYRDGDWNVFAGQYFTEFNPKYHVTTPIELPKSFVRFISIDYGYSANVENKGYSAVYWHAFDKNYGKLYTYRELCVHEHTGEMLAEAIVRDTPVNEVINWIISDNNIANTGREGGKSVLGQMTEVFEKQKFDVPIHLAVKGPNSRVNGWNLMRAYMRVTQDEDGTMESRWQIFNNCKKLIETIPLQVYAEHGNMQDLDTDGPDDCVDSIRYGMRALEEGFDLKPPPAPKQIPKNPKTAEELFEKMQATYGDLNYT